MNKKIVFGMALISILLLSGCVVDKKSFCNEKGYRDYAQYGSDSYTDEFFCYNTYKGNVITSSKVFTTEEHKCKIYYKGDGCADN